MIGGMIMMREPSTGGGKGRFFKLPPAGDSSHGSVVAKNRNVFLKKNKCVSKEKGGIGMNHDPEDTTTVPEVERVGLMRW